MSHTCTEGAGARTHGLPSPAKLDSSPATCRKSPQRSDNVRPLIIYVDKPVEGNAIAFRQEHSQFSARDKSEEGADWV